MERNYAPFEYEGIEFGYYPAEVCKKCHEAFFEQESARKIERAIRRLGLFGFGAKWPGEHRGLDSFWFNLGEGTKGTEGVRELFQFKNRSKWLSEIRSSRWIPEKRKWRLLEEEV